MGFSFSFLHTRPRPRWPLPIGESQERSIRIQICRMCSCEVKREGEHDEKKGRKRCTAAVFSLRWESFLILPDREKKKERKKEKVKKGRKKRRISAHMHTSNIRVKWTLSLFFSSSQEEATFLRGRKTFGFATKVDDNLATRPVESTTIFRSNIYQTKETSVFFLTLSVIAIIYMKTVEIEIR